VKLGYWPKSFSKTVENFKNLFTVMISIIATSLLVYSYNSGVEGLPLLAVGSLGFFGVGVFSIAIKKVGILHYLAAIIGFVFSAVSIWLDYGHLGMFAWSLIIGLITFILSNKENRILWLETSLAYSLLISLLL
jgi:hypothetical protein